MEEETKNKHLIGIVGALIGTFGGAIPWILLYIFANMMYSILAILIVLGGYYGYKVTGAKIDKKLPVVLSITSFISITVTMFLIIPICLMIQEAIPVTIENIQYIYGIEEFTRAIATDYVVSLLFCILVISGIIVNLNKQIREGINEKDIKLVAQDASTASVSAEDIEKVKTIFEKEDALNKNGAIEKQTIMENLSKEFGEERAKKIFNYLKVQQIIKKKSGKFYFSERAQNSFWYRYGMTSIKTFIIIVIVAIVLAIAIVLNQEENNEENLNNTISDSIIENNTFKDTFGLCAYIASAGNVIVRNNSFYAETPRETPQKYRGGFRIQNSENIKVVNNRYNKSPLFKELGVSYDTRTSKGIVVEGNTID